jgi:hypothetical protein
VCAGACCAPGLDCCTAGDPVCIDRSAGSCCDDTDCTGLTDTCNTGVCDPSTHLCIAVPIADGTSCGSCATCQSGHCATCDSPLECCQDSICVDPTNGGCCDDGECSDLADACNTGICDPTTHRCATQPLTDGTSCGTCRTCAGGICSQPCESPLLCCGETTCVDPDNGGCCADTDCPTSTDPCVAYRCTNNQCVSVDAITCASGQECLDGDCVCVGGNSPCGQGNDTGCCAAGETCQTFTMLNESVSHCCPDGTPACFDFDKNVPVCCGGNASCQKVSAGDLGSITVCCEGEPCVGLQEVTCCPSGQVCSEVVIDTATIGMCCEKGHAACFDGQELFCCAEGETCSLELETMRRGFCCATDYCNDANKGPGCCAADSTCQSLDRFGQTQEICCPGEACLNGTSPMCCGTGETCQSVEINNQTYYTCCAGEPCITQAGVECCGAGESCKILDAGTGITIGVCCADGIDACLAIGAKPVCCGDEGFTCQPLTLPGGTLTVDVCCDGPPCPLQSGVVCCAHGQICDATRGCQDPV